MNIPTAGLTRNRPTVGAARDAMVNCDAPSSVAAMQLAFEEPQVLVDAICGFLPAR